MKLTAKALVVIMILIRYYHEHNQNNFLCYWSCHASWSCSFLVVMFLRSDKEIADYLIPQLLIAQIHLVNLSAERADMVMNITIDNPAPVGLNLNSLYYTISIEGYEVMESTYADSLQIDANDSTAFSLPLTVYNDKLMSLMDKIRLSIFICFSFFLINFIDGKCCIN